MSFPRSSKKLYRSSGIQIAISNLELMDIFSTR
jgi:hypothetical protein